MIYKFLWLTLFIAIARTGPVKRPKGKEEHFAMDFFEDFNNLFGYDWWGGKGSEEVKPVENDAAGPKVENIEWKDSQKQGRDAAIDAMVEDVLQATETHPSNGQKSAPVTPIGHPAQNPQPSHHGQWNHPVQSSHGQAHQQPVQSPHSAQQAVPPPYMQYQYPPQGNHPGYPQGHYPQPYPHPPYYYPPAFVQTPQGVQPLPSPHSESGSDTKAEQAALNSKDAAGKGVMPPPSPQPVPYPYYYLPSLPYHHQPPPGLGSESSLEQFMSQPAAGPVEGVSTSGGHFGAYPPRMMFLDPSMDTYMSQGEPTQAPQGQEDDDLSKPMARSYARAGDEKETTIDLQTMLNEKKAADAELEAMYEVMRNSLSTTASPPSARMMNNSRQATAELLARDPLDYSSLSSSKSTPPPAIESIREYWEDQTDTFDDEENVSELDETTICQTAEGLIGSCDTPTECAMVSGHPSGSCTVPSVSGDLTCCLHTARCGQQSAQLVTYIHNEQYPVTTSTVPSCPISIALLPDICQVRLDFLHFSLAPPVGGSCDPANSITLSTTPGGHITKKPLCGHIADAGDHLSSSIPHLYAHYNRSHSPLPFHYHQLNLHIAVENFPSTWNIRVAQIRCDLNTSSLTPLMATSSCSQWYTSSSTIMDSVILLSGSKNQFRACIKPDIKACAIKYHFYSVVCNMQDKVEIMGTNMSVCGVTKDEWEVVVPASNTMGVVVTPGKEQDGGASSYTVGYTLLYDCTGVQF